MTEYQIDVAVATELKNLINLAHRFPTISSGIYYEIQEYTRHWSARMFYAENKERCAKCKWNEFSVDIRYQLNSLYGRVGEWYAHAIHLSEGDWSKIVDCTTHDEQATKKLDLRMSKKHWDRDITVQVKRVSPCNDGFFIVKKAAWEQGEATRLALVNVEQGSLFGSDVMWFRRNAPPGEGRFTFEQLVEQVKHECYILKL
jgi:hypothetical protein